MPRFAIALISLLTLGASTAHAQGVILRLPADGAWVRYEGSYQQAEIRPETATGKVEIPAWLEHVTLKSVGSEDAEFRGETVKCRWLEVKVERGRESEGKIDTGLTGLEIYKFLVPESAVVADATDAAGVPVSFLPIIKGFRKIGAGEPKPLTEAAVRLYPLAVLLAYVREFNVEEKGVDPGVGLGAVQADKLVGVLNQERPSSRTQVEAAVWASPDVPFGIAAWSAKITRSVKDDRDARENFRPIAEVIVELKARESGMDAKSEIEGN